MTLAILQARVSSTRLPEKVLAPVLGAPMLLRQIERIRGSRRIDQLAVATSNDPSDDPLEELCRGADVTCYRGSLNDVLDRYYECGKAYAATNVVRLTGDCPLADPRLIDHIISAYLESGADYASNTLQPTYPDGLDVEVFRFQALERAWREASLPSEREHVTPYIYGHGEFFSLLSVTRDFDLSDLRWTVDNPEDLEFVRRVYEALYPSKPDFETDDILDLLARHPELGKINAHIGRNEGLKKSLLADKKFLAQEK